MRHPYLVLLSFLLLPTSAMADENPLSIMREADKRHRLPEAERFTVKMILQETGKEPRERQYEYVGQQNDDVGDRARVHFLAPANIRGTALLTAEQRKKGKRIADDDQWLYLSAFKKTRRVGAAELGDRFMASDIFYEDAKRRNVDDYSYKLLRSEPVDGQDCFVIEAAPSDARVKASSPYGKSEIWVRKDIMFIVKMRHFDRELRPLKEMEYKALKAIKGKVYRANQLILTDVRRKHRTTLVVANRRLEAKLAAETFSPTTLTRLVE